MPAMSLVRMRHAVLVCCLTALAACTPGRVTVPTPATPQLEAVNLVGRRVCPSFDTSSTRFTLSCAALPTSDDTGWLITPLTKPHPTNPNWNLVNHGVVVVVSGPSLTTIEVGYWTPWRRFVLSQVPAGPARPYMLVQGGPGEVEVAATDDGTRKTWRITVNTDSCSEQLRMDIVNIGDRGIRSDVLPVTFFRNEDERGCFPAGSTGTLPPGSGGNIGVAFGGMGSSVPAPPPGPCPGGAARTLYHLCETCSLTTGSSLVQYVGLERCSLAEALGSIAVKPACSVRQVGGSNQC